jgi:2-polyprenyl-3-methyl-5-hydroxy-6-metoxy-1,4-benzoquinol methylase
MNTESSSAASGNTYVLGHDDVEVQRLLLQGRLYNDYTEHALRLAGLRPGMRVLDIGCGPGDVSFIAARLVGPTGTVLGVDAAPPNTAWLQCISRKPQLTRSPWRNRSTRLLVG